jgi:hypothetical protein
MVHSFLDWPQASQPLGMTKERVTFHGKWLMSWTFMAEGAPERGICSSADPS